MIQKRSRYNKVPVVELPTGTAEPLQLISLRPIPIIQSVFFFTPTQTDRLDLLANDHYRDPRQFFRIADASHQMDPFDVIEVGSPLPIPPLR
jgi:nucleoid-associated protein YgaU